MKYKRKKAEIHTNLSRLLSGLISVYHEKEKRALIQLNILVYASLHNNQSPFIANP